MASVSGETPVYERMLTWAVWATDRRHVPVRHDVLSAGCTLDQAFIDRVAEIRQLCFPARIEAVEKAVAELRIEQPLLYSFVEEYFLCWHEIAAIAADLDESEHHVTEYLQRALRILAKTIPHYERRVHAVEA